MRSEESSVLALGERFVDCGPGSDGVGVFGGGGMPPPEPRCLPPGAQHCRRCYSAIELEFEGYCTQRQHYNSVNAASEVVL